VAKASVSREKKFAPVSWNLAVTSPVVPESADDSKRRDVRKRNADPGNEDAEVIKIIFENK
jgi:hypothetical protein